MKLLLHICCAPCSVACIRALREEGIEPTGYWYNPNIHPFTEYRARRDTLRDYAASIGLELRECDEYGLRPFLTAVGAEFDTRCGTCYSMRLRETARYAKENGFDGFSSTLFISPYQNREALLSAARNAAGEYGIPFVNRDFRPLFREGQAAARERGLYMQKYCGCIFSEQDRYDARFRKRSNS